MSEARPFASQTGKSPSEKKRVTLRDVAEEAGVSLKTASNVINHTGRMTDATREKVQKVVDRLGYRVNVSARNLNRGRTGFITLAVPCLTAPYLAELANRVIDAARIYGYSVYVTTYAEGTSRGAASLLRNFNATVSDGMILSLSEMEDLTPEDLSVIFRWFAWARDSRITRRTTSHRTTCKARVSPRNICLTVASAGRRWSARALISRSFRLCVMLRKATRSFVCAACSKRAVTAISRLPLS